MSWHISSMVTRDDETGELQVVSYAHLFDSCAQDWYAVGSVFENLLENVKRDFPAIKRVYFRSDEAGCYHTSQLIAAVKDISDRVGITVERYDFSEPQQGKDICDRVLCPMKASIRKYCSEGHDILTTSEMRVALLERPVRGTTAAVGVVNDEKNVLKVNKIECFSELHNFKYESKGLRIWRVYGIGKGRVEPWNSLYVRHQGSTDLSIQGEDFFEGVQRSLHPSKKRSDREDNELFVCPEQDCDSVFDLFLQLELHIEIGVHERRRQNETYYDTLKRDWAEKFASIYSYKTREENQNTSRNREDNLTRTTSSFLPLKMGWALAKPRSTARFSENVRSYLNEKFEIGQRTGRKADPEQISIEMRTVKNVDNVRRFERREWLTRTQIAGFFSRLASRSRRGNTACREGQEETEDQDDVAMEEREEEKRALVDKINQELGLQHPIVYKSIDLCSCYKKGRISQLKVGELKEILSHFDVTFQTKDKKATLISSVCNIIEDCQCNM